LARSRCDCVHTLRAAGATDAPLQCLSNTPRAGPDKSAINKLNQAELAEQDSNRRDRRDRRQHTFRSLVHGSFAPRRRGPRRDGDLSFTAVDWHHPQWLAVAILTLLLCSADALLTLTLLDRGAVEANPFMQPLVGGSPLAFTLVKMGLTSSGIVTLILLARVRILRTIPVSLLLYTVLFGYAALVGYEFWLLDVLLPPS
jgi:hypothetical protein